MKSHQSRKIRALSSAVAVWVLTAATPGNAPAQDALAPKSILEDRNVLLKLLTQRARSQSHSAPVDINASRYQEKGIVPLVSGDEGRIRQILDHFAIGSVQRIESRGQGPYGRSLEITSGTQSSLMKSRTLIL